ncbi:MAG TPA: PLD nuclease N-terminal domain-containing protein [Chryseolinea sp.]|nr:PLD nuclease N-terminal domain-containing protein [Chryseolinea sp.]HPH47124.1 PLD nuclease N-terminal domain-containing protein [Chryseolinea sp.]HPM30039.1 PLD nuclease N-terminal domain-containing protein [Chryseolinea sp.]
MWRIISFLILIVDIIIVIEILQSKKDTEKKVLWIVVVFFLPVLGPILYYLIGRK